MCIPNVKPQAARAERVSDAPAQKVKLTKGSWIWALTMFVLFIGAQIYSIALSFIVDEKGLGTAAQSGNAMAFFAIGGFLLGLVFGRLSGAAKNLTLFIGLVGIIISYLVIAFAGSMPMIYLGAFLFGVSLSVCMPCVIVGTAGSVDVFVFGDGDFHHNVRAEFRSVPLPVYRQSDFGGAERRNERKSDLFPAGSGPDGRHGSHRADLGHRAEQKGGVIFSLTQVCFHSFDS